MNKELMYQACTIVLMYFRYKNCCTSPPIMVFSSARVWLRYILTFLLSIGGVVHVDKPKLCHVQGGTQKQSAKARVHLRLSSTRLLPQSRISNIYQRWRSSHPPSPLSYPEDAIRISITSTSVSAALGEWDESFALGSREPEEVRAKPVLKRNMYINKELYINRLLVVN